MEASHPIETQLEAKLRRAVRGALAADVEGIEPIADQLGPRRFLRVRIRGDAGGDVPVALIARIDAPEDPAGRPPGIPPEPALEPVLAFLRARGLPVPARYGGEEGIDLLEDLGTVSLADAARGAGAEDRRALYAAACDLVPRLQALSEPGDGRDAFARRLAAAHFA